MRTLWDISPPICSATPAFPGDTPYSQRWTAQIGPGCPVNVSAITMSPHLGAHADAPLHYGAARTRSRSARCRSRSVPRAVPRDSRDRHSGTRSITPGRICEHCGRCDLCRRACWCAPTRKAPTAWAPHFAAFAPETIAWLASLGVTLVGIDTPSVDPADSKTLDSHQQLLRARHARAGEPGAR